MDVIADRYELGRTLGAGGMARVVEAYDRVLDRQVAIKLLREDIATDSSVRERFMGEARTAAQFNHPNAVTVFDTGLEGRQPWIAMELIAGEDLSERLARQGRIDELEAVAIADAVLAALEAAHRGGMVHRDVKPGNIMLLDDGRVKLADFGIAKSVQDVTAGLTATGQIIGTAKYLSPEQVDGKAATPASDVYSLGCVLYEMLAGEPPFTGDNAIAIAMAHTRDTPADIRRVRPDVSPAVAAAVTRALAKDPAQRFADAGEMRRALRGDAVGAAAATVPLGAAAATTQVLPNRDRRRGGTPWGIILLAAAVLLGALLLALLNRDDPTPAGERRQPREEQQDRQPAEPTVQPTAPEEQEPTEAPTAEPSEEAPPPIPTDLPSLITLLELQPEVYGTKQEDLRKGLQKVFEGEGDQQASDAQSLQDQITEWIENDELNPDIGNLAIALLEPYATQVDQFQEDDDNGPGKGKGKGNDKDD